MSGLRKLFTGDPNVDALQDAVEDALRPLQASAIVPGRLVGPLTFTANVGQLVAHGMTGASPKWFLVSPSANANVWGGPSPSSRHFAMTASADLTTYLWCI